MKTLLTIAAVITLSSNAYAVNPNDTPGAIEDYMQDKTFLQNKTIHSHEMPLSKNDFWAKNGALLTRFSNPADRSETFIASSGTTGSQPSVGSAMHDHLIPQGNDFWKENGALLDRNHNPNK